MEPNSSQLSLLRIFDQPEFSDLIVTVGTRTDTPKKYYLHQAIVLTAAKLPGVEGSDTTLEQGRRCISIPRWDVSIMDIMFRWIYGDKELAKHNLNLSQLSTLITAARDFQIEDLRKATLRVAVDLANSKLPSNKPLRINKDYWNCVQTVCSMTGVHDWEILRGLVGKLNTVSIRPPQTWLLELARESELGLLAALLLERNINIINHNKCSFCQGEYDDGVSNISGDFDCTCGGCGERITLGTWIQEDDINT
ncbi:hypothetical protein TWF506_004383 [Arthrobotrys conoides]|uniref:BTB domain-containing protein n=1 Tax=Arthrobotrys conoides TaxID=74498 RepID=A0AAN8RIJ2_9PEZI